MAQWWNWKSTCYCSWPRTTPLWLIWWSSIQIGSYRRYSLEINIESESPSLMGSDTSLSRWDKASSVRQMPFQSTREQWKRQLTWRCKQLELKSKTRSCFAHWYDGYLPRSYLRVQTHSSLPSSQCQVSRASLCLSNPTWQDQFLRAFQLHTFSLWKIW